MTKCFNFQLKLMSNIDPWHCEQRYGMLNSKSVEKKVQQKIDHLRNNVFQLMQLFMIIILIFLCVSYKMCEFLYRAKNEHSKSISLSGRW